MKDPRVGIDEDAGRRMAFQRAEMDAAHIERGPPRLRCRGTCRPGAERRPWKRNGWARRGSAPVDTCLTVGDEQLRHVGVDAGARLDDEQAVRPQRVVEIPQHRTARLAVQVVE
jgi:hypothetical protein